MQALDCGKNNGGYYISSQSVLEEINSCTTIYGVLQIVPAPGDSTFKTITLPASLTAITGSLEFYGFYDAEDGTTSIDAPALTSIGSVGSSSSIYDGTFENYTLPWGPGANPGLLIYGFGSLGALTFPKLNSIGGDFLFAENPVVKNIDGFPDLSKISGNVNITGNFDELKFPALTSIGGAINILTTSSSFQCPANIRSMGTNETTCNGGGFPVTNGTQTANDVPGERWTLCQTDACITNLQHSDNLVVVSSIPTKAAMHPGWPETLIGVCFALWAWINYVTGDGDREAVTAWTLLSFAAVNIFWVVTFGFIESEKSTGGWLSVLWSATTTLLNVWLVVNKRIGLSATLTVLALFQGLASWAVIIQRWKGEVGSIAYEITNSHGCVPYDGFTFLQQGMRSRAFRIIQTVESVYITVVNMFVSCIGASGSSHGSLKVASGSLLLMIYIPVLVYEVIIAVKGTPIAISGNCMLVELNPRFGFLDSEIESWWKAFVSITGM